MNDINLLPEENVSTIAENRIKGYSLIGVLGFSFLWVICVGGLFGYGQILSKRVELLNQQKNSAQARLSEEKSLVTDLMTIKAKIGGIDYLKKKRFDLPNSLKYVLQLFPPGISFTKISIEDTGAVVLGLKGIDHNVASSFVSKMGKDPVLENMLLSTFKLSEDGNYSFNISALYGDKAGANNN